MSHRSLAESIEQDRARSAALAATGSNAFSVMMGAAPKQQTAGPKTLQALWMGIASCSSLLKGVLCAYVVHGLLKLIVQG